jgi:hypothetical protein
MSTVSALATLIFLVSSVMASSGNIKPKEGAQGVMAEVKGGEVVPMVDDDGTQTATKKLGTKKKDKRKKHIKQKETPSVTTSADQTSERREGHFGDSRQGRGGCYDR